MPKTDELHEFRTMFSLPDYTSVHSTVINAPADVVWECLSDIHEWQWNRWVRLDATCAQTGLSGTSRLSLDGNGRWRKRKFRFSKVSRRELTIRWTTRYGLCMCTNSMRLVPLGAKSTTIEHTQSIRGLSLGLCFGAFYCRLKKHPLYINEALKHHVESQHFHTLLHNISTREMQLEKSDSTMGSGSSDQERTDYWETPKHLRKELISCYIGDVIV